MISQIRLKNFRCFSEHSVKFESSTVMVGKNNAGKSSIVDALRILASVINRKSASFVPPPKELDLPAYSRGIIPAAIEQPTSIETLFYRYGDPPAEIKADCANGASIIISIGESGRPYALLRNKGEHIHSWATFESFDPMKLYVLPSLGPVITEEQILGETYVADNLFTRLSSRHLRNQIFRCEEDVFRVFKDLAESSWPRLQLTQPVRRGRAPNIFLTMDVREGDFATEIGYMGHGLQMWLQIIWFISRTPQNATIVLDEPDIYMHPDLQRKLYRIVTSRFRRSVIATHSVEIMSEADPNEILVVDKARRKSNYATNVPGVQALVDELGGLHNVHLARLWNARRILLVEGDDVGLLRLLHRTIFPDTEMQLDGLPSLSFGGWGGWQRAIGTALTLPEAVGKGVKIYAIMDRDYHADSEIQERLSQADSNGINLHVWHRKEIENYLVVASAIKRLIDRRLTDPTKSPSLEEVEEQILAICELQKDQVLDEMALNLLNQDRSLGASGANKKARTLLIPLWADIERRKALVSGKEVLSRLSDWMQKACGVSFGPPAIAKILRQSEIDEEVKSLLNDIETCSDFSRV